MARHRIGVSVCGLGMLFAGIGTGQTLGATITGNVTDGANGRQVARAQVYAVRMDPTYMTYAPVTAGANGVYSVGPLPPGTYKVCVVEERPFAPNCLIPDRSTDIAIVSQPQTYVVNVALRRGSRFSVRVNDTPGLARQRPGLIFLLSDARGNVYPLSPSGTDAGGQSFEVTIPADVPLSLTAKAVGLVVRDEQNALVGAGGVSYPFQHSSTDVAAGRPQKGFTFTVAGLQ